MLDLSSPRHLAGAGEWSVEGPWKDSGRPGERNTYVSHRGQKKPKPAVFCAPLSLRLQVKTERTSSSGDAPILSSS